VRVILLSRAKTYDDQFAKVLPINWEMDIFAKYLDLGNCLLDVGCGTGRHFVPLARKGLRVLGIDKDKEFVEATHNKLKTNRLATDGDLIIADACCLPLKSAVFDAIICMGNVLGDVEVDARDRLAMVQEMSRVAKLKAVFIVELVHRYWQPKDLPLWLYRYLVASIKKLLGKNVEYGDYTETIGFNHREIKLTFHAFTNSEAKQLFVNQGLRAKIEKRGRFFHDWFIAIAMR
jgi:ubiquinone/menaquinone biosynthesis C-methylase UbiE